MHPFEFLQALEMSGHVQIFLEHLPSLLETSELQLVPPFVGELPATHLHAGHTVEFRLAKHRGGQVQVE